MMVNPGSKQSGIVFPSSYFSSKSVYPAASWAERISVPEDIDSTDEMLWSREEREREMEREKWGGESGGRDTGRKKTSEWEREREREREGGKEETVLMLSWHRCHPVSLGQARSLTIYLCVCLCRWPTLWRPSAVWCLQPWWWFMPKGAASKVSLHFGYFLHLLRVSVVCVCTGARQFPNEIS